LIQTQEYNQRRLNPDIKISIFKKEIELCRGIVPLVEYTTYTFYLRPLQIPTMPKGAHIVRIIKPNIDLLINFLETIKTASKFDVYCITDVSVLSNLIESGQMYVYCLKYVEDIILGYYFFRNANIQYEDLVEGADDCDTLQFIGSFNNTGKEDTDVFYWGFIHAYQDILKIHKPFKMMLFECISHNDKILEKWLDRFHIVLEHKTAYYLYNFVFPKVVLPSAFFLI
jgi:hypothetical protein